MSNKGFFTTLFDFSFSEFVTTKLIRVLYGINLCLGAIGIVGYVVIAFRRSLGFGILCLILSPVAFILSAIAARVWMELLIVIFRIAENVNDIAKMTKQ